MPPSVMHTACNVCHRWNISRCALFFLRCKDRRRQAYTVNRTHHRCWYYYIIQPTSIDQYCMYLSIHTVDAVSAITKGKEATRPNNLTTYNMHESQSATNITSTTSSSNERMGGNTQQQKKNWKCSRRRDRKECCKTSQVRKWNKSYCQCVCVSVQYNIFTVWYNIIRFANKCRLALLHANDHNMSIWETHEAKVGAGRCCCWYRHMGQVSDRMNTNEEISILNEITFECYFMYVRTYVHSTAVLS